MGSFKYLFIIDNLVIALALVSSSSTQRCTLSQDLSHLFCSSSGVARTIVLLKENEKEAVRVIDFSINNITEIESLSEWYPNVRIINFDGNSITKIEIDAFANLTNLENINLSYNLLTEIPTFTFIHNKRLKSVSLSGNKDIVFAEDKPVLCSSSLEMLDMSHMALDTVTKNNFMCLPSIREINLSYNSLSILSADEFSSMPLLSNVYLASNYFICNCQLLKLVKWLGNKKSDITANPSCIVEWRKRIILSNATYQLNCSDDNSRENIVTQDNVVQEGSVFILYYNISRPVLDREIRSFSYAGISLDNVVYTAFPFLMFSFIVIILVVFYFYSTRRSTNPMYVPIYDTKSDHRVIPIHIRDHTYMQVK